MSAMSGTKKMWRLCKKQHAATAFSGEGARLFGGRWNHRGTAVAYAAQTLSLATLEMFVHVDPGELPDDLVAIPAELPEHVKVERMLAPKLPKTWRDPIAPEVLKDIGTAWATRCTTVALYVPSAIVPEEENILINPQHADFKKLKIGIPRNFSFDPRMRKK